MFDILVVVVLVDIIVVAVVEQERQRRWDKSPSKRFPAQCVFFSSIFAVCIVVDIAIVVVEGLECWSGQNHILDKFSEMEMSKSWCFDVLQLWPLPSTFQHSFVTWQVRHAGVQCSEISISDILKPWFTSLQNRSIFKTCCTLTNKDNLDPLA